MMLSIHGDLNVEASARAAGRAAAAVYHCRWGRLPWDYLLDLVFEAGSFGVAGEGFGGFEVGGAERVKVNCSAEPFGFAVMTR